MLFWFIAALLTLGASLAVLLPLGGRMKAGAGHADHDLEVYRDQLAELDRDAARGLIQTAEAEQARAEIARRVLKADAARQDAQKQPPATRRLSRAVGALAVLAVPLLSWGIYAAIGSPDLPSQPLAERLAKNPADSTVDELVARAEAHLAANPEDGRGWDVLAPIYLRMSRYEEAANAFRNAMRLDGPSGARESGLGEAIAGMTGGLISKDARAAFERALALEPQQAKASFYLATAMAQEGRLAEAVAGWQAMLTGLPQESPWRGAAEQAIAEARARLAANGAPPAQGPDKAQVDAAASMSDADRNAMIETMVAGLDEKLRQNPRDPEGWARLVRSYMVLGKADAARDAVRRGVAVFGQGSEEAKQLVDFSTTLGLTATD